MNVPFVIDLYQRQPRQQEVCPVLRLSQAFINNESSDTVTRLIQTMPHLKFFYRNKAKETLLHIAIRCGRPAVECFLLIERMKKTDETLISCQDNQGRTALHIAIQNQEKSNKDPKVDHCVVLELINSVSHKDLEYQDEHGATVLHIALSVGIKYGVITKLLNVMSPQGLGKRDNYNRTPLHFALDQLCDEYVITHLITSMTEEDLSCVALQDNFTVLHTALLRKVSLSIIKLIIQYIPPQALGMCSNKCKGSIPLCFAFHLNMPPDILIAIIDKMLPEDFNVLIGENDNTLLHVAVFQSVDSKVIEKLMEKMSSERKFWLNALGRSVYDIAYSNDELSFDSMRALLQL